MKRTSYSSQYLVKRCCSRDERCGRTGCTERSILRYLRVEEAIGQNGLPQPERVAKRESGCHFFRIDCGLMRNAKKTPEKRPNILDRNLRGRPLSFSPPSLYIHMLSPKPGRKQLESPP